MSRPRLCLLTLLPRAVLLAFVVSGLAWSELAYEPPAGPTSFAGIRELIARLGPVPGVGL